MAGWQCPKSEDSTVSLLLADIDSVPGLATTRLVYGDSTIRSPQGVQNQLCIHKQVRCHFRPPQLRQNSANLPEEDRKSPLPSVDVLSSNSAHVVPATSLDKDPNLRNLSLVLAYNREHGRSAELN